MDKIDTDYELNDEREKVSFVTYLFTEVLKFSHQLR